jgi:hypothetical protein
MTKRTYKTDASGRACACGRQPLAAPRQATSSEVRRARELVDASKTTVRTPDEETTALAEYKARTASAWRTK